MELTTIERMNLLTILPAQENILTLKIVRKLRETLSFNESELKELDTRYEFICPFRGEVNGKPVQCDNKGFWPVAPRCAEHNVLMVPTNAMNFRVSPEVQAKKKEIHIGLEATKVVCDALKRADEAKLLTQTHISLYEKFFPPEEKTEG